MTAPWSKDLDRNAGSGSLQANLPGIVALLGKYDQMVILRLQLDLVLMKLPIVGTCRRVSDAVLIAKQLFDLRLDSSIEWPFPTSYETPPVSCGMRRKPCLPRAKGGEKWQL